MKQRAYVYVDAFNLYYRCLRGTPYKWLDLGMLCDLLFSAYSVERIRYFTAIVEPRRDDPQQQQRQQAYIRALRTDKRVSVHFGLFQTKPVRLILSKPPHDGPKTVEVLRTEEKGSDVNLATFLIMDALRKKSDVAVVVSNDSDLKAPIQAVRTEFHLPVGVVIPSAAIRKSALPADFYRRIRQGVLTASQFPASLADRHGSIHKPESW